MQLVHNAAMAPMYVSAVREALRDGVPKGVPKAETKALTVAQPPRRSSAVDFQWAADDSDDVLQYLPQFSATSFAGDESSSVVKARGPKNTLGGKGERALSFFVAKPDAVVQTETITPQYDTVRKMAPTVVFGSAPRPSICDAEPDDRGELHVSDTFVRRNTPSAVWSKMTSKRPIAEHACAIDDDDTPLWPLPEPVALDDEFRASEKTTKKGACFGGSARDMTWAGRITEEDIQRAKNQLDVAAAKNHVLPRTAVAAFSQVARFSDEWSGKSLRRMQPGLDDKERVLKELNQPAIPSDAIVKPRAPAANFGRASEKKTTAVTSQSTDLEPLTVKYDAVIPRVVGSAWKPAASKAEDNPSTQAIRAMRVGPGAYDVAKAERLLRPRSSSVVTWKPAKASTTMSMDMQGLRAQMRPELNVDKGLAIIKPRVKGVAMGKAARAIAPAAASSSADSRAEEHDELVEVKSVTFRLVEKRVTGGTWRPPASASAPKPRCRVTSDSVQSEDADSAPSRELELEQLEAAEAVLRKRSPAWQWQQAPAAREEVLERPRSELKPKLDAVRPSLATSVVAFDRMHGRFEESRRQRLPAVGQYNFADAWEVLQKHVPAAVWKMANERWEGGVTDALLSGGQQAFLELHTAVNLTRPSPPAWSFVPLPSSTSRRPHYDRPQPELEVTYSLVRRRTPATIAWEKQDATGAGEWLVDQRYGPKIAPGMYDPSHDLVERQVTTTVVYDKGSRREILDVPSNAEPAEGDHLDLDVILASMAIAPNHGTAVHMSNGNVPRLLNTNNSLTAQVDFLDPWADIVLHPHVPGVDIGKSEAHPVEVKPKDASEWKRGPGMYGAPEFVAKEAPAWDFGVAPGRPKTVLDEPGVIRDGDRLNLEVGDAYDAVLPTAPTVVVLPEHKSARPTEPGPGPDTYTPSLALVQPALPGALAFDTMAPKRLPEPEHIHRDPQYHPEFDLVEPRVRVPDLGVGVPRFPSPTHRDLLEGNRLVLDVDAADRRMRPHHMEALPFEKQLARVDDQANALTADLYYDTDIGVVRPRAPAAHLDVKVGHLPPRVVTATDDLDGGYYEESHVGLNLTKPTAPATDFGRGVPREVGGFLGPMEPPLEGDNLVLHLDRKVTEAAVRPRLEQPFSRVPRRFETELQPLDVGDNLVLPVDTKRPVEMHGGFGRAFVDFGRAGGRDELWGAAVGGEGAVVRNQAKDRTTAPDQPDGRKNYPVNARRERIDEPGPLSFGLWPNSAVEAAGARAGVGAGGRYARAAVQQHIEAQAAPSSGGVGSGAGVAAAIVGAEATQKRRVGRMMERLRLKQNR